MLYRLKSFKALMGIVLLSVCMALASCNKALDINSSSIANEQGHWKTYEDARSGLIGLYGLFRAALADNNNYWMWGDLRQGDFKSVARLDLKAVIDGNLNSSYPTIQAATNWRRFYAVINACNVFIERDSSCLADLRYTMPYYKLDIAQARTLRAFAYFCLVRIWGDVPFTTTSGEGGNFEELPRTNKDVVLAFANKELIDAASRLPYLYSGVDPEQKFPNNYYGYNSSQWLNMPITRLGAYALLAHIAAWQGRYIDAAVYTEFIENNFEKAALSYTSSDDLVAQTGLFSATPTNYNQLVGFSFIQNRGETSISGHIEQLTLANTITYPMSKQFPDIYIPKNIISEMFPGTNGNDDRFGVDNTATPPLLYTRYFENYNAEIPVFKKIRVVDGGTTGTGNYAVYNSSIIFTRLEEIMLLRAEALAMTKQEDKAVVLLNRIRGNRKLEPVNLSGNTDIIYEIFQERRRELMGEGWRWFDLVRYNRIKRNNPAFNALLDNGGIYWPIAQDVLDRNAKLGGQNSYWK